MPRSDSARAQRAAHGRVEALEVAPGGGGLERLHHHAAVEQVVAQVRARGSGPRSQAAPGREPSASPPPARSSAAGAHAAALHLLGLALEAHDRQAAALVPACPQIGAPEALRAAPAGRQRQRHARLVLVGQARDVGRGVGLLHHPERLGPLGERRGTTSPRSGAARAPAAPAGWPREMTPSTPSEPTTSSRSAGSGGGGRHGAACRALRRARSAARPPPGRRCARSRWTPGRPIAWPPSRRRSRTRTTAGSGRASGPARRAAPPPPGPSRPPSSVAVSDSRSTSSTRSRPPQVERDHARRSPSPHAAPRRPPRWCRRRTARPPRARARTPRARPSPAPRTRARAPRRARSAPRRSAGAPDPDSCARRRAPRAPRGPRGGRVPPSAASERLARARAGATGPARRSCSSARRGRDSPGSAPISSRRNDVGGVGQPARVLVLAPAPPAHD